MPTFKSLHDRLVRLIAHEQVTPTANDVLREVAICAAELYIDHATRGTPSFDRRLANWKPTQTVGGKEKPVIIPVEVERRFFCLWEYLCSRIVKTSAAMSAEFVPTPGMPKGSFHSAPERWKQRAERYIEPLRILAERAGEVVSIAPPAGDPPIPLTPAEQLVYDVLDKLPAGKALTGKELLQRLAKVGADHVELPRLSGMRKSPAMRQRGFTNRRGAGYYLDRQKIAEAKLSVNPA